MKRIALLTAVFVLTSPYGVSEDKPVQLTNTEQIAIRAVMEKNQHIRDLQKEANELYFAIASDVAKAHPGYHLDPATAQLEKDIFVKHDEHPAPAPKPTSK